ncbi:MAG: serine/threonine protein kinase [Deltaproteobacteria bacterium]|nr:MAG: serine/threonine protein kinase [Deltaproteobacteria bacterium]
MKIRLEPGTPLVDGRYILEAKLGEGGMATVWAAQQNFSDELPRNVVLKILLSNVRNDEDRRAMFMEEARLSQQLRHPYVVNIYSLESWNNLDLLIMERLWGVSLDRFIKKHNPPQPLPWPLATKLCSMAAQALHYANQEATIDGKALHLIHRDIKPANLLLTTEGILKVIDFGIAKATISQIKTRTGLVKGTVAYMSPEQLHADPLDIRSDLHSLGVVLYQLCSGERPFVSDSITSLILKIISEPHKPLIQMNPEVPVELSHVVDRLLSKERIERPSDALLLHQQLEDVLAIHNQQVTNADLQAYFQTNFPEVFTSWQQSQQHTDEAFVRPALANTQDSEDTLPQRSSTPLSATALSPEQQQRLAGIPAQASTVRVADTPLELPSSGQPSPVVNGLDDDDDDVTLRRRFQPQDVRPNLAEEAQRPSMGSEDTLTAPKSLSSNALGKTEWDDPSLPQKLAQMQQEMESSTQPQRPTPAPPSQERWFKAPQHEGALPTGSQPPNDWKQKPPAPSEPLRNTLFEDEEYTYREASPTAQPITPHINEEWRQVLPANLASMPADATLFVDSQSPEHSPARSPSNLRWVLLGLVGLSIAGALVWYFLR